MATAHDAPYMQLILAVCGWTNFEFKKFKSGLLPNMRQSLLELRVVISAGRIEPQQIIMAYTTHTHVQPETLAPDKLIFIIYSGTLRQIFCGICL